MHNLHLKTIIFCDISSRICLNLNIEMSQVLLSAKSRLSCQASLIETFTIYLDDQHLKTTF